jgi:tetratricopeptide (TPR) repeat protein
MDSQSLTAKRIFLNACLVIVGVIVFAAAAFAGAQDPAERQRAIDLYEANNFVAALPLLEKVAAASPNDPVILSKLGFAIYANAATEKDPALRQKMRDRAKTTLLHSRSLGDNSNLTAMVLDSLSAPDATQVPFSNIQTAEAAIREGEAAFVKGDLDKAIAAYKRALDSDPRLYDAALYAGDAEFKKGSNSTDAQFRDDHFNAAGTWFAKAVAIDADRETAYRYWGDALDAQGKTNLARDKFVEAIIAEPYGRRSYVGLTQWGQRHRVTLGHPRIDPPNSTSTQDGKTTLSIDPKTLDSNDGSNEWLLYDLTRAAWLNGEFLKNYPAEKVYRHSLKEETTALRMVAEAAAKDLQSGKVKALSVSLDNLVKINDDGMLEPYILFAHPDQGIAHDYPGYRTANRDKLRRYWLEVVIGIK